MQTIIFIINIKHNIKFDKAHFHGKKIFNQDEKRLNARLETGVFLTGQKSQYCFGFISNFGICSIYLSLSLGNGKFKQLD